ncbi:aspartyl/asparaginyl beta-hydroxylase domain-containing protein [Lysobacter sp. A3-1-A15]|uniref:aspartyl/asparaginyl beta-hydroxylase domain-containing protein n=1 Tax=Novilysobacter viscosus TaxID=3098602 RepID=UPI002ED9CE9B
MRLQVPFIQLPLLFDAARLADEVGRIDDSHWRPHPQGFEGNSMLPLVAVSGNPDDESFAGSMQPTPALASSPTLRQVFASLGATIGRSRLMRLSGHAEVARHADQGYYWAERVRVHVPIVTQPSVRFECGDAVINMAAGECWIFDTWRQHRVLNDAVQSRIHLVVDTVGGEQFWSMLAGARPHTAPRGPGIWEPRRVAPTDAESSFACERVNVPVVMTPWELNAHMGQLMADAQPHPNLQPVRQATMRFARAWHGLWSRFGDAPDGHDAFRELLARYLAEVARPAQPLVLNNQLRWFDAMQVMVARAAVVADASPSAVATGEDQRRMGDNA